MRRPAFLDRLALLTGLVGQWKLVGLVPYICQRMDKPGILPVSFLHRSAVGSPVALPFDCMSDEYPGRDDRDRRSRLPRKAWRLGSRNQEGNTLHTFALPHLRNLTVSVRRSEAILAPLATI